MTLIDELSISLAGSTLFSEANVITVIDLFLPSFCGISITTEELKSPMIGFVYIVLFKMIKGVSIPELLKLARCFVIISRDCNNDELTPSGLEMLYKILSLFLFRKFHESLA